MKTQLTIARQSKDANEDQNEDNDAAMFVVVVVVVSVANITHYN